MRISDWSSDVCSSDLFDHISGSVALTIGNYRRRDFKASLNLPLTDSLAVTLSGATINRDGNVRRSDGRDLGNEQRLVGRFALRWKASSRDRKSTRLNSSH